MHKRKNSSLNDIIEQSLTKAENCVYLSEILLFIRLLTMIIRGKSPLLIPSNYSTVINRNENQRHLIGYTWIEKDSGFSEVAVRENIYQSTRLCFRYTKVNKYFSGNLQINE